MFTGIVERMGTVRDTRVVAGGRRLLLDVGPITRECKPGDSVSVQGVCLTVATVLGESLGFDVIAETLQRTTLGRKRVGDRVNLERSLKMDDRLDGHFVQGHIDGTAAVTEVRRSSREYVIGLRPDEHLTPYLVAKGSVAIDGVSLTIADVREGDFTVALIPTTLERTTLSTLTVGDLVNIESDIIARTIVHRLAQMTEGGPLTRDALQKAGFL
ncbi:MAG: riboflavin synthase [Planctomycetota bacterium]